MACRAKYMIERDYPGEHFMVIRDVGPWDKYPTVTNDAEAVVADLIEKGYLQKGRTLAYIDSDGHVDQLLHDGEKFTGFAISNSQEESDFLGRIGFGLNHTPGRADPKE